MLLLAHKPIARFTFNCILYLFDSPFYAKNIFFFILILFHEREKKVDKKNENEVDDNLIIN